MQSNNQRLVYSALHSTAIFLTMFVLIFVFYYFVQAVVGTVFKLNSVMRYYGNDVLPDDGVWRPGPVRYTFASGPIACLMLALVFKYMYLVYFRVRRGSIRLALLWGHIIGVNFFLGGIVTGVLLIFSNAFSKGFGHAIEWAYVPKPMMIIMALVSLAFLIIFGAINIRGFLQTAWSSQMIEKDYNDRPKFIVAVVVLPWLISTVLLTIVRLPRFALLDVLNMLMLVPVIFPILAFSKLIDRVTLVKNPEYMPLNMRLVIIAVATLVLYRLGLELGIEFKVS